MGVLHAPTRKWTCLSAMVCVLLVLTGCALFRRHAIQPTPDVTGLRFVAQVDTDGGDRVRVDLGVANRGSTQVPADSQWAGDWIIRGPSGEGVAQGSVTSLPTIAGGEPFTSLCQWTGTLEPGFYKITWGALGYGSILTYVDVQRSEQGMQIRTQTAYQGVAYPPVQTVTAMDWIQTSVHDFASGDPTNILTTEEGGGALRLASGSLAGVYTSTVVAVGLPFNAVVAHWDADLPVGTSLRTELRVFGADTGWSEWYPMDGVEWSVEMQQFYPQSPLLLDDGRQFQYRVTMAVQRPGEPDELSPVLREMTVTYVDTHEGPTTIQAKTMARANAVTAAGVPSPVIIPRIAWGADESYRSWAPEYRDVQKVVIHHTVTPSGYPEEKAASWVRAIYYYHAVTQGWGDIGYNYLVDQYGNIYEGRYGGPGVVGGHVSSYNYGTMGIGLLGTFGNYTDSASPTDALLSSLSRLCAWEAGRSTIHPLGKSEFRDITPPNIAGHRDYPPYSTTCPGNLVYAELGRIRTATWDQVLSYLAQYRVEWLGWESGDGSVESGTLNPGQAYTMTLRVRNSGWFVWPHAGGAPVRLAYRWLDSRGNPVSQAEGDAPGSPLLEDVAFGQTQDLASVSIRAPAHTGKYTLVWDMVHKGAGRFHELNSGSPILSMAVIVANARPTVTASSVPTVTPTSTPLPQAVQNGGFEGVWAWIMPETPCTARYASDIAHSGESALQTGIEDPNQTTRCYSSADQTVVVPTAAGIALTYWYQARIDQGDLAYVYIRPEGGAWRLLGAVRQDQPSWVAATLGLEAYRGKTVTVRFGIYNDGRHGASVMFVDDVALSLGSTPAPSPVVETPLPGATPTPIVSAPTRTPAPVKTVTPTPTTAPCSELAANGDMEADRGGWSILNTPYKAQYTDAVVRTGDWALQLGIPNTVENRLSFSSAEQQVHVPAGATATLSLWYRMPNSGGSGDYGYLLVRPLGSSWRVLRLVRTQTVDWTLFSVDVSHYGGQGFDLRLGTYNNGTGDGGAAVMYVDSLSVRACLP